MAQPIAAKFLPREISNLYEVHNYRNAAQVLATSCPNEFGDLIAALAEFRIATADIKRPGGNESGIPKLISGLLRPKGWEETRIKGDVLIQKVWGKGRKKKPKAH